MGRFRVRTSLDNKQAGRHQEEQNSCTSHRDNLGLVMSVKRYAPENVSLLDRGSRFNQQIDGSNNGGADRH